ncbi:hypothetical protein BDQ17DRAFT_1244618 [Cyathus striatus]|nr:hypothetical protein BDQ17DRAFT_1244618 [Cyathus striatus]
MPPLKNWGVDITDVDENGNPRYKHDGTKLKKTIRMRDGILPDGTPQSLYFPDSHQNAGLFKGMAVILEERGYTQCSDFRDGCAQANQADCCCRRMLYNEPDFVNVKSRLEEECQARGFLVLFLPKFHCKLNFIEQCWGYSKRIYQKAPPSSKADDLQANVEHALEAVPLHTMRRFANRAERFMDAYLHGLDGKQAAWAGKKYKGHRVLPPGWRKDFMDNKVTRYDGTMRF